LDGCYVRVDKQSYPCRIDASPPRPFNYGCKRMIWNMYLLLAASFIILDCLIHQQVRIDRPTLDEATRCSLSRLLEAVNDHKIDTWIILNLQNALYSLSRVQGNGYSLATTRFPYPTHHLIADYLRVAHSNLPNCIHLIDHYNRVVDVSLSIP
jgi:hypothetical protein